MSGPPNGHGGAARPASGRSRRRPDARGQTTIDYAIGISLFLLTVAFVFAFVPSMLDPFADAQDRTLIADRAATQLTADLFGDPDTPYVMNETCVEDFFGGTPGDAVPAGCEHGPERDLNEALGVDAAVSLNATLADGGTVAYASGPEPPTRSESVVTAQRVVVVGDQQYRLYVRVW